MPCCMLIRHLRGDYEPIPSCPGKLSNGQTTRYHAKVTFGEEFYLTTGDPWRRFQRNLRLLRYIAFMAWAWLVVGGRVRRARRKAQHSDQAYYVDELASGELLGKHTD